jgi:hypothetical protein
MKLLEKEMENLRLFVDEEKEDYSKMSISVKERLL